MQVTAEQIGQDFIIARSVAYGHYQGQMRAKLVRLFERKGEDKAEFEDSEGNRAVRANDYSFAIQETAATHDKRAAEWDARRAAHEANVKPINEKFLVLRDYINPSADVSLILDHISEYGDGHLHPTITIRAPLEWLARNAHRLKTEDA